MAQPPCIGDICRLSDVPQDCLVVDVDGETVTVAWRRDGKAHERTVPWSRIALRPRDGSLLGLLVVGFVVCMAAATALADAR